MQSFSANATMFSKEKNEKVKKMQSEKLPSKVAHNQPRPFFPTVQPRPQPTAQN